MFGEIIPTLLYGFSKAVEVYDFGYDISEQHFTLMCADGDEIDTILTIIIPLHTD